MFKISFIILKRKKYALIALLASLVMFIISYYLTVINIYHKSIYLYAEMNGYLFTIVTILLAIIISILFGLYIALLVFKKNIKTSLSSGDKSTGTIGAGIGIVASGCPSCGVPLLGFIGFPFILASLPFKGLGIKIVSIILLLISIYYISVSIKKNLNCKLNISNK